MDSYLGASCGRLCHNSVERSDFRTSDLSGTGPSHSNDRHTINKHHPAIDEHNSIDDDDRPTNDEDNRGPVRQNHL
ncbi:MAG: hypothetical protein ACC652_06730, partial [Acidimicrobiales bacterium]